MHLSYDGRLAAAHLLCATASATARSALSGQNRKLFGVRRESDGASQYPLFAPQASLIALVRSASVAHRPLVRSASVAHRPLFAPQASLIAPCSLRKRRSSPLVRSASVAHRPLFAPQASLIAPCSLRKRRSSPLVRSASVALCALFAPQASHYAPCSLRKRRSMRPCSLRKRRSMPLFAPQASLTKPEESNNAGVFATVFVTAANAARRRLSPADPGRTSDPDH